MESRPLFCLDATKERPALDSWHQPAFVLWNPFPFGSNKLPEQGLIPLGRCTGPHEPETQIPTGKMVSRLLQEAREETSPAHIPPHHHSPTEQGCDVGHHQRDPHAG